MGLRVSVYRPAGMEIDTTNGGISGENERLTLTNLDGPSEPTEGAPGAVVSLDRAGTKQVIMPEEKPQGKRPKFGGNFAYSSDERFPVDRPLPIHDRFE